MVIPKHLRSKLIIVDPHSSRQIPHVKDCDADPERGWLEVYTTTPCCNDPDMQMLMITKNAQGQEQTERRNYTFIVITETGSGQQHYATRMLNIDFDVVDKFSGEVMYEVRRGLQVSFVHLDPAAAAAQKQAPLVASV